MNEALETLVEKSAASCGSIGSTQRSEMPETNPPAGRRGIASRARDVGRKPLDLPRPAGPAVEEAVVQPVGAALPELDLHGRQAVAAPVRRTRRRVAVARFHLGHRVLQYGTRGDRLALRRRPGG